MAKRKDPNKKITKGKGKRKQRRNLRSNGTLRGSPHVNKYEGQKGQLKPKGKGKPSESNSKPQQETYPTSQKPTWIPLAVYDKETHTALVASDTSYEAQLRSAGARADFQLVDPQVIEYKGATYTLTTIRGDIKAPGKYLHGEFNRARKRYHAPKNFQASTGVELTRGNIENGRLEDALDKIASGQIDLANTDSRYQRGRRDDPLPLRRRDPWFGGYF